MATSLPAPQTAEAYFRQGVLYSQQGDHENARTAFLNALKLEPNSVAVLNNLGVNALNRHDEAEAEHYFHKVLTLAPTDPDAAFNLGLLELKQKRFAPAAEHLKKAAAARQDLPGLRALLEAHMGLSSAITVSETATRILTLAPRDLRFYFELAAVLSDRSFYQSAQRVLERARVLWPDSVDVAYNLAVVHFEAGEYGVARSAAEAALKNGERADIHHLLGDIYEKLNLSDKAVLAYQAALGLEPDSEDYHFALGYEFLLHHNFDLAEQIFSNAVRRLPRALKPGLGLAAAYFARAKYAEAIETLKSAVSIAPDSELAYAMLGRAFLLLSDYQDLFSGGWIMKIFQEYIKLKPKDAFPYYLTAVSSRSNPTEAARLFNKALALDPNFAEAYFELGKIHYESEQYPDAVVCFENAVRLKPDLVAAYYRLSRAYAKSGQPEEARKTSQLFAKLQKQQETEAIGRDKAILRFVYEIRPNAGAAMHSIVNRESFNRQ